jgi:hypothetical protein
VGTLHYVDFDVDFGDRLLAHLQIVIGAKLRRGEAFYLTWKDDVAIGDGRTSIWLHPAIPLRYKYYGSVMPRLNPAWIDELILSANSPGGLWIMPEPPPRTSNVAKSQSIGNSRLTQQPRTHTQLSAATETGLWPAGQLGL